MKTEQQTVQNPLGLTSKESKPKHTHQELLGLILNNKTVKSFPYQIAQLKKLRSEYSDEEICYAALYYQKEGIEIFSVGYLTMGNFEHMAKPINLMKVEQKILEQQGEESGSRNRRRFEQSLQTKHRAEPYFDLFEEP